MRTIGLISLLALATGCAAWPFGRPRQPADPVALVDALRAGGYVVYLRHTNTEFWHGDAARVVLEDCATQRNLSDAGREQARAIGVGMARLLVPVGEVRSSPYCRCAETARLAFDRVLLDTDLATLDGADAAQRDKRETALRRLLSTRPAPGTNTVLVSHLDNFVAVDGAKLGAGEAAVVRPLPEGGFQLIARVPADAWSTMTNPAAVGPRSLTGRAAP
jgi:phosphohistidine phosphatase SixA